MSRDLKTVVLSGSPKFGFRRISKNRKPKTAIIQKYFFRFRSSQDIIVYNISLQKFISIISDSVIRLYSIYNQLLSRYI